MFGYVARRVLTSKNQAKVKVKATLRFVGEGCDDAFSIKDLRRARTSRCPSTPRSVAARR